jgi:hypothetical protein
MNDVISFLVGLSLGGLLTLTIMFVIIQGFIDGMRDNHKL